MTGLYRSGVVKHPNIQGNPREELSNYKERGAKKFYYTYQDIAEVLGISISRVQHLKSEGKIDPASLMSVVEYLNT